MRLISHVILGLVSLALHGKRRRRRISDIEAESLNTLPRLPGLIQRQYWGAIPVVVEGLNPKKTLARSSVTIVTKKATMQPSAQSQPKQKTSIGLDNLCVGYWGY